MNDVQELINVLNNLSPRIPLTVDLWSIREIAAYFKRSEAVVRYRIVSLSTFPAAIRLPVPDSNKKGHPLWKARDVIEWAEKHQDKY